MPYHERKPFKTACRACKAPIWMIFTKTGKYIPVNAETITNGDLMLLEATDELIFDPKKHMAHFATCSQANKFRKQTKDKRN